MSIFNYYGPEAETKRGNKEEKIKCTCYISDDVEIGHETKKLRELGSRKKIGGRINLWIV